MSIITLIKVPPLSIIERRGDRNLSPSVCNYPACHSLTCPGKLDKVTHSKIAQVFLPCCETPSQTNCCNKIAIITSSFLAPTIL